MLRYQDVANTLKLLQTDLNSLSSRKLEKYQGLVLQAKDVINRYLIMDQYIASLASIESILGKKTKWYVNGQDNMFVSFPAGLCAQLKNEVNISNLERAESAECTTYRNSVSANSEKMREWEKYLKDSIPTNLQSEFNHEQLLSPVKQFYSTIENITKRIRAREDTLAFIEKNKKMRRDSLVMISQKLDSNYVPIFNITELKSRKIIVDSLTDIYYELKLAITEDSIGYKFDGGYDKDMIRQDSYAECGSKWTETIRQSADLFFAKNDPAFKQFFTAINIEKTYASSNQLTEKLSHFKTIFGTVVMQNGNTFLLKGTDITNPANLMLSKEVYISITGITEKQFRLPGGEIGALFGAMEKIDPLEGKVRIASGLVYTGISQGKNEYGQSVPVHKYTCDANAQKLTLQQANLIEQLDLSCKAHLPVLKNNIQGFNLVDTTYVFNSLFSSIMELGWTKSELNKRIKMMYPFSK